MSELELDKHKGFRVGFLVQLVSDRGVSRPEGVLLAIRRDTPKSRYRYVIEWRDGTVAELSPAKVVRSIFGDFPHWESEEARLQRWATGSPHYWIRFHEEGDDFGSCLFCGRMRGILASNNLGMCPGVSRIELRTM